MDTGWCETQNQKRRNELGQTSGYTSAFSWVETMDPVKNHAEKMVQMKIHME